MKNIDFTPAISNNAAFSGLQAWRNASNLSPVMAALLSENLGDSLKADVYQQSTANAAQAKELQDVGMAPSSTGHCENC